jgi:hypothetical protein
LEFLQHFGINSIADLPPFNLVQEDLLHSELLKG